jgi:hypothetical protein
MRAFYQAAAHCRWASGMLCCAGLRRAHNLVDFARQARSGGLLISRLFLNSGNRRMPAIAALILASSVMVQAAPQAGTSGASAADQKELFNYTLTMDKIHKLGDAMKDMEALQKSNPELDKSISSDDSEGSLDQLAAKIQKYPPVVAVLKKDGLTPREYIVVTMTLIQASLAVGLKKAGTYKDYPPKMLELVSQANLTFLEKNWDDVQKTVPALSAAGADGGGGK